MEKTVLVTGCRSGLGLAIAKAMEHDFFVVGIDKTGSTKSSAPWPFYKVYKADITRKEELEEVKQQLSDTGSGPISVLINCAAINLIKEFRNITEEDFNTVISTNVKSILITSQVFLEDLVSTKGTIVNIVSNASHMPMTHSFVYNASKGAADIATKQMARELTKQYGITVFGISPNKLKGTGMSEYINRTFPPMRGMTYSEGVEYQKKSLLTGKETEPEQIAAVLSFLLRSKWQHEFLTGCVLPMGL